MLYNVKIAVVGKKTAGVFTELGIRVDYMPDCYSAWELSAGLPYGEGESVLLFRAEDGTPRLAANLSERGFTVVDTAVYRTVCENAESDQARELLENGTVDFVTFTSASTVQGFVTATAGFCLTNTKLTAVCIGEETAAEARKHGYPIIISEQATIESITEKILEESGK